MEDWKKRFLETSKDLGYDGEHAKKKKKSSSSNSSSNRTSSNSRSGSTTRRDSTGKIEFGNDVSRKERLNFYDMNEKDYDKLASGIVDGSTTAEKYLESRDDLSPDVKRAGLGNIKYNDTEYYTDTYKPQVQAELDKYAQQQQNQLDRLETQTDFAINRNNDYLDQQLDKFQAQKNQNNEQAAALQNRRGGFYSGGLDYNIAQNNKAATQAGSQLSNQVASQNAELNAQYAQMAEEATQKLNQMRQQAPDKVRQLVQQALQGEREAAQAEAEITGMYNGMPTLEAQKVQGQQAIDQANLSLKQQAQQYDRDLKLQQLAIDQAKLQMDNQQWQAEFEQDAKEFGMQYAIDKALAEGKLSYQQAQQALDQAKFQWDQTQDTFDNQMERDELQWDMSQDQWNRNYKQDKFQWEQDQAQEGGGDQSAASAMDLVPELTSRFVREDPDTGEQTITDEQGLFSAIASLSQSEAQLEALSRYYGLGDLLEEARRNFQEAQGGVN